jgi:hypothetical protein
VLTKKWPNHEEVQTLKQRLLGKLTEIFGIPDPCGYYEGFIRIVAIYIKYIQCGVNYKNKQVLCSATVRGYAEAVNNLFELRSFSPPADLSDPNNMTAILLNNMLQEEDIARLHAPLDNKIFAKLRQTTIASKCKDLVSELLFDVVALGCYIGPCLSKYAQTTQIKTIIILIHLVQWLSRLSLPTTSSMMRRSALSRT